MTEENKPQEQQNQVFQKSMEYQTSMNAMSKQMGYEIPVESVALPSKGVLYSLDHPLSNEPIVEIKCMTAAEEDLLTSRALIRNGTVISKLLEACILNKTVNPDDLLVGDRNAILIAIRITGYGSEYTAKIQCPECEEQFEYEFSLSGLEIKPLGAQPLQPNMNLFSYTLPVSKKEIQFKLLTGHDESEISQISARKKKLGSQVESGVTNKLLYSICAIPGCHDRNEISRFVMNMPARDSRALRKYIDDIEPEVKMKQSAKCKHCGEESEVSVPLGLSFFWPDVG